MILPEATLLPQAMLPLFIFEPRYRRMLADALATHRFFCVAMRTPGTKRETPLAIAGLGLIRAAVTHQDGTSHLVLEGVERVQLGEVVRRRPYRVHQLTPVRITPTKRLEVKGLLAQLRRLVVRRLKQDPTINSPSGKLLQQAKVPSALAEVLVNVFDQLADPAQVADWVACCLLQNPWLRQGILEMPEVQPRLQLLIEFLKVEAREKVGRGPADDDCPF